MVRFEDFAKGLSASASSLHHKNALIKRKQCVMTLNFALCFSALSPDNGLEFQIMSLGD
jgi:hypothetical protein